MLDFLRYDVQINSVHGGGLVENSFASHSGVVSSILRLAHG